MGVGRSAGTEEEDLLLSMTAVFRSTNSLTDWLDLVFVDHFFSLRPTESLPTERSAEMSALQLHDFHLQLEVRLQRVLRLVLVRPSVRSFALTGSGKISKFLKFEKHKSAVVVIVTQLAAASIKIYNLSQCGQIFSKCKNKSKLKCKNKSKLQ